MNLVVSIIGAKYWGLNGVIIGTIVSSIIPNYFRPYVIYKYVFEESNKSFNWMHLKFVISFIASMLIVDGLKMLINLPNAFIELIVLVFGAIVVELLVCLIFFRKNIKVKEYIELISSVKR